MRLTMVQPDLFHPAALPFSLAMEIGIDGEREQARLDREREQRDENLKAQTDWITAGTATGPREGEI